MDGYNIIDLLIYQPIRDGFGDKVILIEKENNITYNQLSKLVNSIISHKSFLKFPSGIVVACVMEDSIFSIAIFLALIYKGIIPCILNPHLSIDNYKNYLDSCQAKILITSENFLKKFSLLEISIGIKIFFIPENIFHETKKRIKILATPKLGDKKRPAFCIFTSGTTGNPLAVMHRHVDIEIMNDNYVRTILEINSRDKIFATSRFYFAYGINTIFITLLNKATLVIAPLILDISTVWGIIIKHKPTVFFSVPTMYMRLLKFKQEITLNNFSFLRICISAGEKLPQHINKSWRDFTKKNIIDGIGTTEILSTFISNRKNDFREDSTGKPVLGFSVEIRDSYNKLVDTNEIGVLWVKGNTYIDCYFNNISSSKERFLDGWFKTNDLFSKDKDGFYYYHGRISEIFKVSGIWIYPYRIEQVLNTHPAVFESAVIGKIQDSGLMRPEAFVVINKGFSISEELTKELQELCKKKCSKHEYPHIINYIDNIPKTYSGKLKRYCLK